MSEEKERERFEEFVKGLKEGCEILDLFSFENRTWKYSRGVS